MINYNISFHVRIGFPSGPIPFRVTDWNFAFMCATYPVSLTRCDLDEKCKLRSVVLCSVCLKFDFRSDYYKNKLPAVGHCEILV